MNRIAALLIALFFSATAAAQGFKFENPDRKKIAIPFQFINNLIIIPVELNGTKLNFLLDTGVDETILFSLDDQDAISLNSVERIKLKGLGANNAVEGLKSAHNKMAFPGYSDNDHDIYIVLDQNFNFSASIGIPVNGILGYHFFRNNLVEINYDSHRVIVHNDTPKIRKKIESRFQEFEISIDEKKPYSMAEIDISGKPFSGKLLIDSGSTDAVWLFQGQADKVKLPELHFEDFLGRGLSGDIQGERGRIAKFTFHTFAFEKTLAAFPDSVATKNINLAKGRIGSVGGEILKRFDVVFDYKNGKIFLRKSNHFDQPFNYNMSGIEVHHEGMSWVQEQVTVNPSKTSAQQEIAVLPGAFTYKFELKPIFSISNIRKGSPAEISGLKKGDILTSINGIACHRMSLQEINNILKSEEGKTIQVHVERKGVRLKFKFRLKNMI